MVKQKSPLTLMFRIYSLRLYRFDFWLWLSSSGRFVIDSSHLDVIKVVLWRKYMPWDLIFQPYDDSKTCTVILFTDMAKTSAKRRMGDRFLRRWIMLINVYNFSALITLSIPQVLVISKTCKSTNFGSKLHFFSWLPPKNQGCISTCRPMLSRTLDFVSFFLLTLTGGIVTMMRVIWTFHFGN